MADITDPSTELNDTPPATPTPEPEPERGALTATARREQCAAQAAVWARDYDNGMSIRAIARTYGASYGAVHRHLELAGVTMRPRGGPSPARRQSQRKQP